MLKKPHYIILVLVVLVIGLLLKLPYGTAGRVKLALSGMFLPLFGLAGSAHQTLDKSGVTFFSKAELAQQRDDLRRENSELQFRLEQYAAISNENLRLRSLVGWPGQRFWKVRLARVIARDPANWWRSIEIDLGERDGVKANVAVMTVDGLVGRTQYVSATRSQVILLGNPELRVAAQVMTGTNGIGDNGVINATPGGSENTEMVDLDYLSGGSVVKPGNTVVTWGEGGVFPPNIPIGTIVDLRSREFGLTTQARVKLAANLNALQEVWVMMP